MSLATAEVKVPLSTIDEMRNASKEWERRAREAESALDSAKLDGDDGVGRVYCEAFLAAMRVVHWIIGENDPMTIRGWPYEALFEIVEAVEALGPIGRRPGIPESLDEVLGDIKMFAKDAKYWEDQRAAGTEKEALAAQNSMRGSSVVPDLPEAPVAGPGISGPTAGPA
jgi:hypothetical protein